MQSLFRHRVGLSVYFFLSGLVFSSWASRIPTIKTGFDLNEAELGSILIVMPISSLMGLPISGWLVNKYDSRWPLFAGFILHSIFLLLTGLSDTIFYFSSAIFLFALSNRVTNIAMNTQAINLQNMYTKKINGSFHGLWSLGGIAGVGITTAMVALDIGIKTHFLIISIGVLIATVAAFSSLMKKDKSTRPSGFSFRKPDPLIMMLGFLIFFAAICEGGMFDWSGIYFKEVIKVEIFTAGYLMFMTAMALSRFLSDWIIHRIGMPKMFGISSAMVFTGLAVSALFPYFWPSLIGFMIVGAGTAAVVPMVFTLAGTSKRYSPGTAISMIGTFGLIGFMIGPPLIGYIAHMLNLRYSFVFLAFMGIAILPISIGFFKKQAGMREMDDYPILE